MKWLREAVSVALCHCIYSNSHVRAEKKEIYPWWALITRLILCTLRSICLFCCCCFVTGLVTDHPEGESNEKRKAAQEAWVWKLGGVIYSLESTPGAWVDRDKSNFMSMWRTKSAGSSAPPAHHQSSPAVLSSISWCRRADSYRVQLGSLVQSLRLWFVSNSLFLTCLPALSCWLLWPWCSGDDERFPCSWWCPWTLRCSRACPPSTTPPLVSSRASKLPSGLLSTMSLSGATCR